MQITIYRGTHEVGGTMIEMKSSNTRILIDAGYPLFYPTGNDANHAYQWEVIDDNWVRKPYQELLALGVIPMIRGLYFWETPEFDAVLISHAHSDHFGILKYIHPSIPVYLTEATDQLILMNLSFPIPDYQRRDRRIVREYKFFNIGDFMVKSYLMDHSAWRADAFEICCEGKTVIYTGDFRGHGRRAEYLERFLREVPKVPDLLLIEGTTIGRTVEQELTEGELEAEFKKVMENSRGIVLCQPTAQNIDRVISFCNAARACGKIFIMDVYTANVLNEMSRIGPERLPLPSLWRPDIRVFSPSMLTRKMEKLMGKKFTGRFCLYSVGEKTIRKRQNEIVMLIRPSMLTDLKRMKLKNGVMIYSMWQVYREKEYQIRLEEYLKSQGFQYTYLHTSGHAFEEVIKKVIETLSPKEVVPIHTFDPEAFLTFHPNVVLRRDGVPFVL